MPYLLEICKAGKTIEVSKYYSSKYNKRGYKREKKAKPTTEQQKEINKRQAEIKLTRIMNANFQYRDWLITLNYKKGKNLDKEQMKKDIQKFLRKARTVYKKSNKELKYIHVMEIGKRGARHHHLLMNNIDPTLITDLWEHGFLDFKPLDDTGQYSKIAHYFIKYSDTYMGTDKELQGKRWNASKNLIHPVPEKKIISKFDYFRREAKAQKGFYVDKESIEEGIHEKTGYLFFRYTLVMIS
ncbi:hypothetical protein [uncultured Robinsoniella sp.]|uniref:rolling circle replication-associated protein n=1 Tax=uncultured Robinsoniella sp. TaxID=904190 RepID=UPI00290FFB9E|nr:hypothetical protein [Clostridiales bacterium]